MINTCQVCGIELQSDKARTCSPKCRKMLSRQASVTSNVSVTSEIEPSVTFRFRVAYSRKPGDAGYDSDVEKQRKQPREAKYWYDIPLAAVPIKAKDWPDMPEFMNGRQYFLWWKNEFEAEDDGTPIILNPFKR
jgi:hypothetical protein